MTCKLKIYLTSKNQKLLFLNLLGLASFSWTIPDSNAQAFNRYRHEEPWSLIFSIGGTQYFGDLYSFWKYGEQPQPNPALNLSLRKNLAHKIKGRLDLGYYQISGDDKYANPRSTRIPRNLHFRANNFESSLVGEYYFNPIKVNNITRSTFNPYIFAGLGITTNSPKAKLDRDWMSLRPLKVENESYKNFAFTFPVGVGLKYKLNVFTDLQFEINYKWTSTDYLDDVSALNIQKAYMEAIDQYNPSNSLTYKPERLRLLVRNPNYMLPNGEPDVNKILASNGKIRRGSGNEGRNDGYLIYQVGIEIYLSQRTWDDWIIKNKKYKNFLWYW
jgi:hypothetical protein